MDESMKVYDCGNGNTSGPVTIAERTDSRSVTVSKTKGAGWGFGGGITVPIKAFEIELNAKYGENWDEGDSIGRTVSLRWPLHILTPSAGRQVYLHHLGVKVLKRETVFYAVVTGKCKKCGTTTGPVRIPMWYVTMGNFSGYCQLLGPNTANCCQPWPNPPSPPRD